MDKFFKSFALATGVITMIFLADVLLVTFGTSFIREAEAVVVVRARPAVGVAVVTAAVVTTAVVASSSAQASAAAQANANASAQANQASAQATQAAAQANQASAQATQAAAQANQATTETKAAAAKAQQPPPSPPAVGSIVTTLPAGCTQTKLNKIDYMRCGSTYYKPAMVGDKVVFVVSQP
jgi:hypothetical protein